MSYSFITPPYAQSTTNQTTSAMLTIQMWATLLVSKAVI